MKKPYSKHGKLTLLDQFTYLLLRNSSALSNVAIETILHQNIIKPCKEQTHAEQSFQYFEAIELPHSQRQHAEYSWVHWILHYLFFQQLFLDCKLVVMGQQIELL